MNRKVWLSLIVVCGLLMALGATIVSSSPIAKEEAIANAGKGEHMSQEPAAPALLSTAGSDVVEENRAVLDVEKAFDNLQYQGEWLGFYLGQHYSSTGEEFELFPGSLGAHTQGVARSPRTGGPAVFYVAVGEAGFLQDAYAGIMVVEMGSLPTNGERLGSNRLKRNGEEHGGDTMFTWPPQDGGVKVDKVVKFIETEDHHPSGMSMVGDILAVPMLGSVCFYNCADPKNPVELEYRLPLIDPDGESTGANAVAITKLPDGRFLLVTDHGDGAHFYWSAITKTSFFEADGITEAEDIFHHTKPFDPDAPSEYGWVKRGNIMHRVDVSQYRHVDKAYLQSLRTEDGLTAWPFKGGGPADSRMFQGMNFVNQVDKDGVDGLFLIGSCNSHEETPRQWAFGKDELFLLEVFSTQGDPASGYFELLPLSTLEPETLHLRGVAYAVKMTRSPGAQSGGGERIEYKYTYYSLFWQPPDAPPLGIYLVGSKRWQANFNAGAGAYVSPSGELLYYAASHFADGELSYGASNDQSGRADKYKKNDFVKMAEYGNKYVSTDEMAMANDEDKPGSCGPKFRENHLGGPYTITEASDGLTLNGEVLIIEPWVRMFQHRGYTGISVMMDWRNQNEYPPKDDYHRFNELDGEYGECRGKPFEHPYYGNQSYNGFNKCLSSFFWCGPAGATLTFYKDYSYQGAAMSITGTGKVEGKIFLEHCLAPDGTGVDCGTKLCLLPDGGAIECPTEELCLLPDGGVVCLPSASCWKAPWYGEVAPCYGVDLVVHPDYDEAWSGFNDAICSAAIDWTPPSQDDYVWTREGEGELLEDPDRPYLQVYTPGSGSSTNTVTMTLMGQSVSTTIEVLNVLPTLSELDLSDPPYAEGHEVTVGGEWSDPGAEQVTLMIDYGDGTTDEQTSTAPQSTKPFSSTFEFSHIYADNGTYSIQVCADDGEQIPDGVDPACKDAEITVDNVAPTVEAGLDQVVYEGDVVTLDPATFSDPGFDCPGCVPPTEENFAATIEWGDGITETVPPGSLHETPGSYDASAEVYTPTMGTVEGSRQHLSAPGTYTVTVCVTDDDGAETCDHLTVTVVHGFLRFCGYADDELDGVTAHQDVVASCGWVPSGVPGEMRPSGLGSRGTVHIKERAAIQQILLSLAGGVDVDKDADVSGTLTAGYDVKVDQRTQIHDSITSGHRVEVKRDARVDGDILAADRVTVDPDATVTGTVGETAVVPPIPGIHWVEFSATPGAEDVTVGAAESLVLEPGAYRDLRLRRGATLTLRAGQYVFRRFTAARDAALELDLSDGTILVDVADKLQLQQNVQMSITLHDGQPTGAPTDVLFRVTYGFDGDVRDAGVQLQGGGAYLGTFLAPYSLVELGEEATLLGALYGKWVEVEQGAQITGMPARDLFASLYVTP